MNEKPYGIFLELGDRFTLIVPIVERRWWKRAINWLFGRANVTFLDRTYTVKEVADSSLILKPSIVAGSEQ